MMTKLAAFFSMIIVLGATSPVARADDSSWTIQPHIAVGYNPAQGNYASLGLDLSRPFGDQWWAGAAAFYSAGQHPQDDREIGGGPFAIYVRPIFSFLSAQVREDVDYLDMRTPTYASSGPTYDHDTGLASITSAGINLFFTQYFGVSAGYQLVASISNPALGDNRSGFYFGISLGF